MPPCFCKIVFYLCSMIQRFADWQKARIKSAYLSAKNKFNEMKNFSINGITRAFANVLLAVRSSSVESKEVLSGENRKITLLEYVGNVSNTRLIVVPFFFGIFLMATVQEISPLIDICIAKLSPPITQLFQKIP